MSHTLQIPEQVRAISRSRVFLALIGLLLVTAVFGAASPRFFTLSNLFNILTQVSIIGVVSVGMTYVMIAGGINLSLGGVVAVSSTILAMALTRGVPIVVAIVPTVLVGVVFGWVAGVMVTSRFEYPAFIATLALQGIARGLVLVLTNGQTIYGIPESFAFLGSGTIAGIPVPAIIMLVVGLVAHFHLTYTKGGVYYYAVGGNFEATRLAGLNTKLIKWKAYMSSAILASTAGILLLSRLMVVEPMIGIGYEMDAIAAAVIGGVTLSGGEGSVLGTLVGALIIGVLRNGLNLVYVTTFAQQVAIGVVIAVAVSISAIRR